MPLCFLPVLALPLALQGDASVVPFKEHAITFKLPALDSIEKKDLGEKECAGEWLGKYKASDVHLRLYVVPNSGEQFVEPDDVVEVWRDLLAGPDHDRAPEDVGTQFTFGGIRPVSGAGGISPIVALLTLTAERKDEPGTKGLVVLTGGLLPEKAWLVRLDAWPAPGVEDAAALVASVEQCVAYQGKLREAKWTDEEALAYWKRIAPPGTEKKFEKPVRTEHFIVLTNSTSPGPYVKKLEGKYASIKKILPFEEAKGRRLLPILLFRTDDDFQAFYRHVYQMETKDDIHEGSLVIGRYLATSCDNDDDKEDLLDLMRLCLYNRQHASGGGRWFHDGLRTYAATKPKERADALRAVKTGKYTPLATLLDDSAWSKQDRHYDERGTTKEAGYWGQSALWMEFLHEGPWPKESFPQFVETVGAIPDDDRARIEQAIESIYGGDIGALQKKWVDYFSKH
jgi:hypothetical protein